ARDVAAEAGEVDWWEEAERRRSRRQEILPPSGAKQRFGHDAAKSHRASDARALRSLAALAPSSAARSTQRSGPWALQWDETSIRARVQGSERYRVRLEVAGGSAVPARVRSGATASSVCTHCVVAGLAWLSSRRRGRRGGRADADRASRPALGLGRGG